MKWEGLTARQAGFTVKWVGMWGYDFKTGGYVGGYDCKTGGYDCKTVGMTIKPVGMTIKGGMMGG